jgi:hypothetical protein
MTELEKISDKELKNRYISLWENIYEFDCYGTHDLVELEALASELKRRGYDVGERRKPVIRKQH